MNQKRIVKHTYFLFIFLTSLWSEPGFRGINNQQESPQTFFQHSQRLVEDSASSTPSLLADFNRDGFLDSGDELVFSKNSSTTFLVLANVDDDDLDGRADHLDEQINGHDDLSDFAKIQIQDTSDSTDLELRLSEDWGQFQFFNRTTRQIMRVEDGVLRLNGARGILVEARGFARKNHSGTIRIELFENDLFKGSIRGSVAPWIMLANSNPTEKVYIATGHRNYPNRAMIRGLKEILEPKGVGLHIHNPWGSQSSNGNGQYHEMWVQDSMEIGYTKIPGSELMHVVLKGLRSNEKLAPQLLHKNFGVISVGRPRNLHGGDRWADWMGNLEVSAPVPGYPLGRIYYGTNQNSGVSMHPEVVEFLEAQRVQSPFSINTSWLIIKHVDEIFNFLPTGNGEMKLIIASPKEAAKINPGSAHNNQYNRNIQSEIDRTKAVIREKLGISDEDMIDLPVYYESGHNIWSNPVNSIHINGTVIFGNTYLPQMIRDDLVDKIQSLSLNSAFVDDRRYQVNNGNVHCATNTKKVPHLPNWWDGFEEF